MMQSEPASSRFEDERASDVFVHSGEGHGGHGRRLIRAGDPELFEQYPNNFVSNTKYTLITFLPKTLMEQFSRFMNCYFLALALLQLIPTLTPTSPLTTWVPLLIILGVSAIKEASDDYGRYCRDRETNEKLYWIVRQGAKFRIRSQDIGVGDIIYLTPGEDIPCDIVMLQTSSDDSIAFLQTDNIDGETELKERRAPAATQHLSVVDIQAFNGAIEAPAPGPDVYSFNAVLHVDGGDRVALTPSQLLLQGSSLSGPGTVYGVVVYTGDETKIGQNKSTPRQKWTYVEQFVNRITMWLFVFQAAIVFILGARGNSWRRDVGVNSWYLLYSGDDDGFFQGFIIPIRYLLLTSLMIPISLKVTMDMIKLSIAMFIQWDLELYDEATDYPCVVNSSAVSEQLGVLDYVLCDKTGTLTENDMKLQYISCNGNLFGNMDAQQCIVDDERALGELQSSPDAPLSWLFRVMSLCHTGRLEAFGVRGTKWTCRSPDEQALLDAAQQIGVRLNSAQAHDRRLDYCGTMESYEMLHVLPFSSLRKRMSVIVRNTQNGTLWLLTKGADDVILPRATIADDADATSVVSDEVTQFARLGLRTLMFAYRPLGEDEWQSFDARTREADAMIENRESSLLECYSTLERQLTVLGVAGIEDRLQPHVADTITLLRSAGLRVWMLTGDKLETAMEVAISCGLARDIDSFIVLSGNGDDLLANVNAAKREVDDQDDITVVIHGSVLDECLRAMSNEFVPLLLKAKTVVCARTSPQQKTELAHLLKEGGKTTLAIGDGGNDVGMIQEASVGVGLSGREGLQAARAADFSLARFHMLARLILVHGRWSFKRLSFIAQFCMYKSFLLAMAQILYAYYSGFSGVTYFSAFSLVMYNLLFTAYPIAFRVLDKEVEAEDCLKYPELYTDTRSHVDLNTSTVGAWYMRAVYQGLIAFFFTVGAFGTAFAFSDTGQPVDYESLGQVTYTALVLLTHVTLLWEANTLTLYNVGVTSASLVVYFIVMLIYSEFSSQIPQFGVMSRLYSSSPFWLACILIPITGILPNIVFKYWQWNYKPLPFQLVRRANMEGRTLAPLSYSLDDSDAVELTSLRDRQRMKSFDETLRTPLLDDRH